MRQETHASSLATRLRAANPEERLEPRMTATRTRLVSRRRCSAYNVQLMCARRFFACPPLNSVADLCELLGSRYARRTKTTSSISATSLATRHQVECIVSLMSLLEGRSQGDDLSYRVHLLASECGSRSPGSSCVRELIKIAQLQNATRRS